MTASLQGRLLLAAILILVAFLGLTGYALDRAFRTSAEVAVRDRLQGQLYGLLAAADLDLNGKLVVPDNLPELRFSQPGSGLYGRVHGMDGLSIWDSRSLLGVDLPVAGKLTAGESEFGRISGGSGMRFYALRFAVSWEGTDGESQDYVFAVAEGLENYLGQVSAFRGSLSLWLGAAALLLLVVQGLILRWGLAPLRKVADEVRELETGRRQQLQGSYPGELVGLTSNINTLIRNQRRHLDRYRNTLDDLAHSLKTPLAVLRSIVQSQGPSADAMTDAAEQVARMTRIVDYQLSRAAASDPITLASHVAVAPAMARVIDSLQKIYAEKGVSVAANIVDTARFYGEEGDLFEILGNLLDNAFKLCSNAITVSVSSIAGSHRPGIEICIADDGPGIPRQMTEKILERGVRADSTTDGQGIGLAVVADIVRSYDGKLNFEKSAQGGAKVCVSFPAG